MKILFNSRKYDRIAGGVERMSIAMMNELTRRGHQIEVMSLDPDSAQMFYPLDPRVRWTRIDIGDPSRKARLTEIWARQSVMRNVVRRFQPDVAIGFQQGAFVALAVSALGTGTPVIAAERNAPHRFDYLKDGHGRRFQYASFRLARFVTIQFLSFRDHYPDWIQRRIVFIPNPVFPSRVLSDPAGRSVKRKTLLCVARLSYQKQHTLLIDAFARIASQFPDWDLELVGDGEDRLALEAQAASSVPPGRVRFVGSQADVYNRYRTAQLFCLPSRWEGFPNALAEAMASGLPAVGLAGCAGVNELIQNGRTGILAPESTSDSLAKELAALMASPARRKELGAAARAAMAEYAPSKVFDQWEALFKRATQR